MTISVKVIADSVAKETGIRITTVHARYPRMVHADLMTHRKLSRNGRSSRAVPNNVLLKEEIVEPLFYGVNQSGMIAGEELKGWRRLAARTVWLTMAHSTRLGVKLLNKIGLHKQWSNRPLEWFGHIDVLITATEWENFFELRDHEAAQPEIRALAREIRSAIKASKPYTLKRSEWHLPYITDEERKIHELETLKHISVARCARLTFKPFDGNGDVEAEEKRYNRLVVSRPVHASPAEHQATPDWFTYPAGQMPSPGVTVISSEHSWANAKLQGNTVGWIQFRKTLPYEYIPG